MVFVKQNDMLLLLFLSIVLGCHDDGGFSCRCFQFSIFEVGVLGSLIRRLISFGGKGMYRTIRVDTKHPGVLRRNNIELELPPPNPKRASQHGRLACYRKAN